MRLLFLVLVSLTLLRADNAVILASLLNAPPPSIKLINHSKATTINPNSATTVAVNMTGATFFVVGCAFTASTVTTVTITSSVANTFIPLTPQATGSQITSQLFYATSVATGVAQTFTCSGTGIYAPVFVAGFSGVTGFDSPNQNGFGDGSGVGTTISPGSSGTPSTANNLIVTNLAVYTSGNVLSLSSGFTFDSTNPVGGVNQGGGLGWLIQTTNIPQAPTWTLSAVNVKAATIAVFK